MASEEPVGGKDFVRAIVAADRASNKHDGRVVTRFPPEPNGYLHIGHAKAICLDFGIARENGGVCHLRFDDTNPSAEEVEYVDSIKADVRWLGFEWGAHEYYASDYFPQLHAYAVKLIEMGKAYVCDLSSAEHTAHRGTLTEPGRYVLICAIPTGISPQEYLDAVAAAGGQKPQIPGAAEPHLAHGMFTELVVE